VCGLLVLLLLLCLPSRVSAAPPVVLEEGAGSYPLGRHLDVLEDAGGALTFEAVSAPRLNDRWQASEADRPNYGYTESAYRVRFRLVNPLPRDQRLVLEIDWQHLDHIELYTETPGGEREVRLGGALQPAAERDIQHRNYLFDIALAGAHRARST